MKQNSEQKVEVLTSSPACGKPLVMGSLGIRKLYNCDSRTLIELLPTNSLIISDPPYNIGFEYPEYGDRMTDEEYTEMFAKYSHLPCVFINYPEEMIKYICKALGTPDEVVTWCYASNIGRQHRMIAWFNCKPDFSKVKQPYRNPTDKRVQQLIRNGSTGTNIYDWWEIDLVKNVSDEKEDYTNQIPEEVIARIIKTTATDETVIVDPFNGSGTTCAVAEKLGYGWIGIDVSPKAIKIAERRIANVNPLFREVC
jgi:DNA modification methylase